MRLHIPAAISAILDVADAGSPQPPNHQMSPVSQTCVIVCNVSLGYLSNVYPRASETAKRSLEGLSLRKRRPEPRAGPCGGRRGHSELHLAEDNGAQRIGPGVHGGVRDLTLVDPAKRATVPPHCTAAVSPPVHQMVPLSASAAIRRPTTVGDGSPPQIMRLLWRLKDSETWTPPWPVPGLRITAQSVSGSLHPVEPSISPRRSIA